MTKRYNLAKKSDVRRLSRDIERSMRRELRREIPKTGIYRPCPKCGATMRMVAGTNTCPHCGKTVEVTFDLSRL